MTQLSPTAQNLNWLISNFVHKVPGVAHAIVVSADGLLLTNSGYALWLGLPGNVLLAFSAK